MDEIKTPTVPAPKGLVIKLCEVMAAIGWVEKRGENAFHKYKYATEADLVEAVRGELAKRNVFVFPDVKNHSRAGDITDIMVGWTFVDGESGETRECHIPGCGQDKGDKGVYKALTGSEKYLLMKAFLIPTGDDPEADAKVDKETAKDPEGVTLSPYKPGLYKITGAGVSILLTELFETEKTVLGLVYDGANWAVPTANTFRFKDACFKHNVSVTDMDAGGSQKAIPASTVPSNGNSKLVKGVFPKTGQYGPKHVKKGQMWELREVIWGDSKYATFDKNIWPLLDAAKGKSAVLDVVEPTEQGKSGMITGIKKIGDTDYEVIEGKTVPVIQRNPGD